MEDQKKLLFENLKAAGFNFSVGRSAMSGRWQRAIAKDKELRDSYTAAKGNSKLQATIRKDWAEITYDEYVQTHTHTTTKTNTEHDKSNYLTPKRIAWKEGGGKSGWRNACNICLDAQLAGGKMIWYDTRAKGWKYLYNVKGYTEELAEAFSTHKQWITRLKNEAKDADDETGEGQSHVPDHGNLK